jgi:hypothetical protein
LRSNPSLDAVSGATLLFAKLAGLNYSSLVDLSRLLLLNIAENGSGPKLFLTPEEREFFWQHFLDDNKALFDIYTPENAEAGETGFPRPTGNALAHESTNFISFLGNVISNRNRLEREVWQGNTLVSKNLAWLTSLPNKGWFTVEDDGVWSKGPISEISFLLPETSHTAGPVALEITVAGHYAQESKITSVDVGKWRDNLDISRATIRIELDEDIRTSGVLVKFIHGEAAHAHADSLEVDADQKKRYKLKFLSYKYLWD